MAPLYDKSNDLIASDDEKAHLLNEYFCSVFTKDDGRLPKFPRRITDYEPGICNILICPENFLKIMSKLKCNSAAGPDGLPPIFFSQTENVLNFPLSNMYRTFIDLRIIHTERKLSIITQIFKKVHHLTLPTTDP